MAWTVDKTLTVLTSSALMLVLASLTFRQSRSYRDPETLWRRTIAENPRSAMANNNLGSLLYRDGSLNDAMYYLERATILDPKNAEAHNNFGNALRAQGRRSEAIAQYRSAVGLRPGFAQFHANLASCMTETGQIEEAIGQYEEAVKADSTDPFVMNNLAWLLATTPEGLKHDPERALELADKAVKLSPDNPVAEGTLAAAYAASGRFDAAVAQAETAHSLALSQGNTRAAEVLRDMLTAYRARRRYPWK